MSTTDTPRYVVHTTGPKVHYCLDTVTRNIGVPFRTKRAAQAKVDERNAETAKADLIAEAATGKDGDPFAGLPRFDR